MKLTTGIAALVLTLSATAFAQTNSTSTTSTTSTTSITQEAVKVKKSPISALLWNELQLGGQSTNDGELGDAAGRGFLQMDYKFGSDQSKKVSVRPYYHFTYGQDGNLEPGDVMVRYVDSKNGKIFGNDLTTQIRYYAPVRNASKDIGGRQTLGIYNTISGNLGNGFSLTFHEIDFIYGYTEHERGNTGGFLLHELDLGYKINKTFSFTTSLIYTNLFRNTGATLAGVNGPNTEDYIELDLVLAASLSENISMDLSVWQERSLRSGTAATLFNEEEMTYVMSLTASM